MSRKLIPLSVTATLMSGVAMADVPSVATDIVPVHSLVARVMQGVGAPDLIVKSGASPHEYSLRPSEAAALQGADLVFWVGEDLTPWMEDAIETLAGDAKVTSLLDAEGTTLLEFREGALFEAHDHGDDDHDDHDEHHDDHGDHEDDHGDHEEHADHEDHDDEHEEHDDHEAHHDDHADHEDEHGDHEEHADHDDHDDEHEEHDDHEAHHDDHADHEDEHGDHEEHAEHDDHDEDHDDHHDDHGDGHEGHDHGDHDPHAWLSPENARTWLNVIAGQLSAADPENAGAYFANAAAARAELEALAVEVNASLDPVRGGSFIVFHDAYQYFETSFDFPASGAISIGDASDPSPARIAEIQDRIQDQGIDCVLAEPQFNPGIVAVVLDGTDAKTGVIDPLGAALEPGAGLYPQLIRDMASSLVDCLK